MTLPGGAHGMAHKGAMTTILVTGARAPVALHMARCLARPGFRILLADSLHRPISAASACHGGYHVLPPPRQDPQAFSAVMADLVAREAVDLVVPTCEEAFYLAQTWRDRSPRARLLAPSLAVLAEAHNKYAFIRRCAALGLAVPNTVLIDSPAALSTLGDRAGELVFKPVWSRFASRVLVRPRRHQLTAIQPTTAMPWVAQEYLEGEEICAYALSHKGRLTALAAYRGLYRAGRGASVAFAPVVDPAVRRFVERYVAGTGWTGQISFDLIRRRDGLILPLECNPRATSGLHFFRGHDFADAVLAIDGPAQVIDPDVTRPQGVRLALWLYGLPQVLRRGGPTRFLATLREVEDVLDWPNDQGPRRAQLAALREIAVRALRTRTSLQRAATWDIEWDGPDQSSI